MRRNVARPKSARPAIGIRANTTRSSHGMPNGSPILQQRSTPVRRAPRGAGRDRRPESGAQPEAAATHAPVLTRDAVALTAAVGGPAGLDGERELAAALAGHAGVDRSDAHRRTLVVDIGAPDRMRVDVTASGAGHAEDRARFGLDLVAGERAAGLEEGRPGRSPRGRGGSDDTLEAKAAAVRPTVAALDAVALAAAKGGLRAAELQREHTAAVRHRARVDRRGADMRFGAEGIGAPQVIVLVATSRAGHLVQRAR